MYRPLQELFGCEATNEFKIYPSAEVCMGVYLCVFACGCMHTRADCRRAGVHVYMHVIVYTYVPTTGGPVPRQADERNPRC